MLPIVAVRPGTAECLPAKILRAVCGSPALSFGYISIHHCCPDFPLNLEIQLVRCCRRPSDPTTDSALNPATRRFTTPAYKPAMSRYRNFWQLGNQQWPLGAAQLQASNAISYSHPDLQLYQQESSLAPAMQTASSSYASSQSQQYVGVQTVEGASASQTHIHLYVGLGKVAILTLLRLEGAVLQSAGSWSWKLQDIAAILSSVQLRTQLYATWTFALTWPICVQVITCQPG